MALITTPLAAETAPGGDQSAPQIPPQTMAALKSLKPQHGQVELPAAHAKLDLGSGYDFYGPDDARKIIVDIWGNPPSQGDGVLGIVMPAGKSPMSDAWGAVITYEDTGYVSDSDAGDADYASILSSLQENTEKANAARKQEGYPVMHVAGWAESPHYDSATHSVVWARDLDIEGDKVHSLNYDVRTLGRSGVLSVNFVSVMPDLPEVKQAANELADHASFAPGSRYADFDPSADRKAEYGIAGLVAAGVGVAAVKKLGLLAIMLKFIKPLIIAAVAAFAALRKRIAGLFGGGGE